MELSLVRTAPVSVPVSMEMPQSPASNAHSSTCSDTRARMSCGEAGEAQRRYLAALVADFVAKPGLGTAPRAHNFYPRDDFSAGRARQRRVRAVGVVEVAAADVAGLVAEAVPDPGIAAACKRRGAVECKYACINRRRSVESSYLPGAHLGMSQARCNLWTPDTRRKSSGRVREPRKTSSLK